MDEVIYRGFINVKQQTAINNPDPLRVTTKKILIHHEVVYGYKG